MKRKPKSLHDTIVAEYAERGFETRGFRRTLATALTGESGTEWWREVMGDFVRWFPFFPDAFRIDEGEMLVTLVEVEVTNPVPQRKIDGMADLVGLVMDPHGPWRAQLLVVDRFRHEKVVW